MTVENFVNHNKQKSNIVTFNRISSHLICVKINPHATSYVLTLIYHLLLSIGIMSW